MVCDLVFLRKILQNCRALWQHKAIRLLQDSHRTANLTGKGEYDGRPIISIEACVLPGHEMCSYHYHLSASLAS